MGKSKKGRDRPKKLPRSLISKLIPNLIRGFETTSSMKQANPGTATLFCQEINMLAPDFTIHKLFAASKYDRKRCNTDAGGGPLRCGPEPKVCVEHGGKLSERINGYKSFYCD